MAYHNTHKKLK